MTDWRIATTRAVTGSVSAKAFDKAVNYNLGIVEQSIFPELNRRHTKFCMDFKQHSSLLESAHFTCSVKKKFGMPFRGEALIWLKNL